MKQLFPLILATAVGCGASPAPTAPANPAPPATPVAEPTLPPAPVAESTPVDPNKPKPEYGSWGFDIAGMDPSVPPGQSFFRYADGTWLKTTKIPEDKSSYGLFAALADRSEQRTRELLEAASGPPGSNGQKLADYYKTFMDEAAIDKLGTKPVLALLAEVAKVHDARGVVLAFADSARRGGASPAFVTLVRQDDREPEAYIPNVAQGGLGLPDRDMYDAKNAQFDALRAAYKTYIAQMFTLINSKAKDLDQRVAAVYALEEKIAAVHWTRIQNRDPQATYNKMTPAELAKLAPDVDWKPWLKAVGYEAQAAVVVRQPSAITGIAKLVKSEPLAVWKDYLTLHVLIDAAPFLSKPFVDAQFALFEQALRGVPQPKERWKRAVAQVDDALGEAAGELYVAKYFTPQTKAAADKLVKNLLVAMGQQLDTLPWMGPETKAKAKEKLATYNPKIGYPTKWRDYTALKIVAGDALGNARRAAEFEYNRRLAKLGKPVDRTEWNMTPMTVNAYYNSSLNEIVFPAAILQPPFFDPNADDAVNYGGIGAVIGHEISHGFDDRGSQYDAKGALKDWWTADDKAKFKAATAKLVAQYDAYCPFPAADGKPAQCVKGQLTLGENIADVAGLTIAYNAYKLSLGGKPAPVLDGFSGDQRFYFGWAQVWRRIDRDKELANLLVTNPHSPAEFRVATVRNLDPWYAAFQPRPGDTMYIAPDRRVRIW